MQIGTSNLYYLDKQPKAQHPLELDNSYFLVKLHESQVIYNASWFQPGTQLAIFTSTVESTFQPGNRIESLHQVSTIKKNIPCKLGLSTNLTSWLPVRRTDSLRINLKCSIIKTELLKSLLDKLTQAGLVAEVTLVKPEWTAAVKISEIVGKLLSSILQEGQEENIFSLSTDLNLIDLKSGFYSVIGSHSSQQYPPSIRMSSNGSISDNMGLLSKLSYVVFKVLVIPRRGSEVARSESWWELLQTGKEQVFDAEVTDRNRRKLFEDWKATLAKVRRLTLKQYGYLSVEIDEMIRNAQSEVEQKLKPEVSAESSGSDDLPDDLKELLGISTQSELMDSVSNYQKLLRASENLVRKYKV